MTSPNADARLPLDASTPLPPGVKAAAAAAEAAHKAAYGDPAAPAATDPNALIQIAEPPPPAVQVAAPPVHQPVQSPPAPSLSSPADRQGSDPASWEGRFYAMEGRYKQTQTALGQMQEQNSQLSAELQQWMNSQRPAADPPAPTAPQSVKRLVTDADVQVYGPELMDVIQRAARDAVAPDLDQVRTQTQQTTRRVQTAATRDVYSALTSAVPNWRDINNTQEFKQWCRSPDVYSGRVRGQLMQDAFQAADAPRVIAFFQGYLAEVAATGQGVLVPGSQPPVAVAPVPRMPAVDLNTLTAPGRPQPASGGDSPANAASKPSISLSQINYFYSQKGRASYAGREADRLRDEQAIFLAQREGRIIQR